MKKFLNLSPDESLDLDKVIYKNALQLKRDALLIGENNKSYGSATSLLVLSSEEIIKATLVFLHSQNCAIYKMKSSKRFFSDHKIRHHVAQLMEMGAGFFDAMEKWEQAKTKQKVFKSKSRFLNDILNGFLNLTKASQPIIKSKERIEQIQQFNVLKNQGLYVDFNDSIQSPRNNINKAHYKNTELLVSRIFRFYKGLRILYHPCLTNHISVRKVERLQSDLQLLIGEALKDFSFDELKS